MSASFYVTLQILLWIQINWCLFRPSCRLVSYSCGLQHLGSIRVSHDWWEHSTIKSLSQCFIPATHLSICRWTSCKWEMLICCLFCLLRFSESVTLDPLWCHTGVLEAQSFFPMFVTRPITFFPFHSLWLAWVLLFLSPPHSGMQNKPSVLAGGSKGV